MVQKDYPDHHDAELVIKLYELRREVTMRESRAAIVREFLPKSFDELMAVVKSDHPLNTPFRQVGSYWEMVYGMAKHGVIHAEFMLESNGEGMLLFTRVEPYLEQYRAAGFPMGFRNAEWVATQTDLGRRLADRFRARLRAQLAAAGGR